MALTIGGERVMTALPLASEDGSANVEQKGRIVAFEGVVAAASGGTVEAERFGLSAIYGLIDSVGTVTFSGTTITFPSVNNTHYVVAWGEAAGVTDNV